MESKVSSKGPHLSLKAAGTAGCMRRGGERNQDRSQALKILKAAQEVHPLSSNPEVPSPE